MQIISIFAPLYCLALSYFASSRRQWDFRNKMYLTKYVFWFVLQLYLKSFLIPGRIQLNIITNVLSSWELFDRASSSWNANLMQQGNFIDAFLARHILGTYTPSSGALDVDLKHVVFCTEFLDEWWSWEPLRGSCVRCWWRRAPSALKTTTHPKIRCRKPYVAT